MFQVVVHFTHSFLAVNAYFLPNIPRKPSVFTSYLFQLEVKTDNLNCINYTYRWGWGQWLSVLVCVCVCERGRHDRKIACGWMGHRSVLYGQLLIYSMCLFVHLAPGIKIEFFWDC